MKKPPLKRRMGAVAPFVALLMFPVFLLMLAFSVDMGNICFTQAQLQRSADAGALAGAAEIIRQSKGLKPNTTDFSSIVSYAQAEAQRVVYQTSAGNVSNLALASSDVQVGYTVQNTNGSPGTFVAYPGPVTLPNNTVVSNPFPNTVIVTVRRDSTSNNPQPTFFAGFFTVNSWSLTATATASTFSASGFNPAAQGGLLLPFSMPQQTYNNSSGGGKLQVGWTQLLQMWQTGQSVSGTDPNGNAYTIPFTDNQSVGTTLQSANPGTPFGNYAVSSGSDGSPEVSIYGDGTTTAGNFGLARLNPNASPSAVNIENWIANGPSATDIGSLTFPPSTSPATWSAGPGFKNSINSYANNITGEARLIPVYSSKSGTGANATYSIVAFAPVVLLGWTGNGSSASLMIEPTTLVDPSLAGTSYASPLAPNAGGTTAFAAPKLTN